MSGRLVLVVGSQCDLMGYELTMLPSAARDLAMVLTSDLGQCSAALPTGPVLIDPTAAELDDALVAAVRAAHDQRATLVLAFVGHGDVEDDDFYLMAKDSEVADSRQAVLVGQRVKELVRRYSGLDGLIMLIDACHSGLAVDAAGREWFEPVRRSRRRLELLTATDEGAAYGACATRTLTRAILDGAPELGERLHFAELKGLLDERCTSQVAMHLAMDGSREVVRSDPASWIALNVAWVSSPLAAGTGAAVIEQLTSHFVDTTGFHEIRGILDDHARCVVITGPAGCGKSAAVAELAHPRSAVDVHAAVFLAGRETVEQVATEVARQLRLAEPDFADACARYWASGLPDAWPGVDAMEVHAIGPLRHLGRRVLIVLDGVDALDTVPAGALLSAVSRLAELPLIQVVVTGDRAAVALPSARRVALGPASEDDLARYAVLREVDPAVLVSLSSGSWRAACRFADGMRLTATLSAAQQPGDGVQRWLDRLRPHRDDRLRSLLEVLLAGGAGAVLPVDLLLTATENVGDVAGLRDLLYRLGPLVVRALPGDLDEHVGLADHGIGEYLVTAGTDPLAGHAALADAIPRTSSAGAYATAALHRHLLACGRYAEAVDSVERTESAIPKENLTRWQALAEHLPDGPSRRTARARAATWTAKAGDPAAAIPQFRELLDDAPAGIETFSLRNNLAYWTGECGDWLTARRMFADLTEDTRRVLGPHHPETLGAQHLLALSTAKTGAIAEGMEQFRQVLALREQVNGSVDIDTLRSRHNLLYWEAETEHPPPVAEKWSRLVDDLADTVGANHPETLTARYHQALFGAKRGDVATALAEFRDLLPGTEHVLGPWHPDVYRISTQLDFWSQRSV